MFYRAYNLILKVFAKAYSVAVKTISIRPVFDAIDPDATILEVGGGYNPQFTKEKYPNVYHLDHATTEGLRAKYSVDPHVGHLVHQIQQIDFIGDGRPIEDLIPADLKFDVVFSSHALEHQVDLIGHFQSLEELLKPGGRVIMIIPDYRCCFDALRYPSVVSDVIAVHKRGAPVHQSKQIFEHVTRTIDINPGRRVRAFDVAVAGFNNLLSDGTAAVTRSEQPSAAYEDTHAWTFFPPSFELLMLELYMLGYTRFRTSSVSVTYGNQFCTVLERDDRYSMPPEEIMDELEAKRLTLTKRARR